MYSKSDCVQAALGYIYTTKNYKRLSEIISLETVNKQSSYRNVNTGKQNASSSYSHSRHIGASVRNAATR